MTATPPPSAAAIEHATGGALGKKGWGWALFEWARNPYYNVIVISIFTPYFSSKVIQSGELGQIIVSATITIAGVIMAIASPLLGSIVDKGGRKKPFIFVTLFVLAICALLLIFVKPDSPIAVPLGMLLLIIGYCTYTVSELLHNAMLPSAGASKSLPLISGLGLSLGNGAGVVMLIAITIISTTLPFGLTPEAVSRLSAPAVGLWILFFMAPFFLLLPDHYNPGATWKKAIADFRAPENRVNVVVWVKSKFSEHPNVMRYLFGRMIYADAVGAMLTLGGVYVAGVLGWGGAKLGLMAIIGTLPAVVGGFIAGWLDRTIGPKNALIVELSGIIIIFIGMLSITPDSILFGLIPAGHIVWEGAVFSTLSDLTYVGLSIPLGMFLVGSISSSRYMLVHISPQEKIGEFFGFYAMAGSVTVWLGPGLVGLMTWISGSQRIGFSGVLLLLLLGLVIITTVKADKTPEHEKTRLPDAFA